MNILEDLGGCALFAVIAVVVLLLMIGVAVVVLGVGLTSLLG